MMKKTILLVLIAGIIATGYIFSESRVKEINTDPYKFTREVVEIKGKVLQLCGDEKEVSSRGFIFRDDFGDDIKVVTASTYPEVDQHYRIIGMVIINSADKEKPEINIIENSREKLNADVPVVNIPTQLPVQPLDKPELKKMGQGIYILFGLAFVLLVVIAILAFFMISNKNRTDTTADVASSFPDNLDTAAPVIPEPASYIEDSSIKMAAPPEGTLKLLPGKLEMISGYDKHTDIRFFKLPTTEETEFTFGRSPGPNYSHIQFKSPTVSSKQAKMVWTNGKYMLLNYSVTNPTKVNDVALEKDQSVPLEEGSRIEMGEVIFRFHEK